MMERAERRQSAKGQTLVVLSLLLAGEVVACSPPPAEWPAFRPVEVTRSQAGARRLVLPSAYEAFILGQIAFNDGDFAAAQRQFRAALRSDPDSAYLLTGVARAELEQRHLDDARTAIDRALAVDACSEFALCTAGSILAAEGDPEGAMRSLQRAIECEPRQPEAYEQLAALLERQGSPQRAESIYRALLDALPRRAAAHRELARLALARGDGAEASRQLAALLAIEPWHSDAVRQLAELSYDRGDTASARALLETVLSRRAGDVETRLLLVRVLLDAGDTAAAARNLDAIRPDADDVVRLSELARLYLAAHRYERAEQDARQVLGLDASQPIARYVLVSALRHQNRVDEAVASVESTSPRSQGADRAVREGALALWDATRVDEARALLERILAAAPDSPLSRATLARLLESQGHRDEAEALLGQGTTPHDRIDLASMLLEWGRPGEVGAVLEPLGEEAVEEHLDRVLALRARALFALDEHLDEALAMARRALERSPRDAGILALVGALEVALGRRDEGLAKLERASRRRPGSATILVDQALALQRSGSCREALGAAQRAARLTTPGPAEARVEALVRSIREGCPDAQASGHSSAP